MPYVFFEIKSYKKYLIISHIKKIISMLNWLCRWRLQNALSKILSCEMESSCLTSQSYYKNENSTSISQFCQFWSIVYPRYVLSGECKYLPIHVWLPDHHKNNRKNNGKTQWINDKHVLWTVAIEVTGSIEETGARGSLGAQLGKWGSPHICRPRAPQGPTYHRLWEKGVSHL